MIIGIITYLMEVYVVPNMPTSNQLVVAVVKKSTEGVMDVALTTADTFVLTIGHKITENINSPTIITVILITLSFVISKIVEFNKT